MESNHHNPRICGGQESKALALRACSGPRDPWAETSSCAKNEAFVRKLGARESAAVKVEESCVASKCHGNDFIDPGRAAPAANRRQGNKIAKASQLSVQLGIS